MRIAENGSGGGGNDDSDSNTEEEEEAPEHYQPISVVDHEDGDEASEDDEDHQQHTTTGVPGFHPLPNGYLHRQGAEHGVSAEDDEDEGEEEEEENMREASESDEVAIRRAFREDENRRNAPLGPENAGRVREAMRRVSFPEWAPEWARDIPEDRWIDQLRQLRLPPPPPSPSSMPN